MSPKKTANSILHPTDLTPESEVAFAHALRLAIDSQARLYVLHVHPGSRDDVPWEDYPSVRGTLENWGYLAAGSSRADVGKLGIHVRKIVGDDKDIVRSIVGFQDRTPVDLMVMATEGHSGFSRWIKPSIAEPTGRAAQLPTLFVPKAARTCVSMQDGSVTMANVLVPVDHSPVASEAVKRAMQLIETFGRADSRLTLLHVGDPERFPPLEPHDDFPWSIERVTRSGDPASKILEEADAISADLLVMVTEGRHGFLDVLRGSTTDRVLRRANCPLFTIPTDI